TLVVGSRGAGKTSLMSALMLEIPQNLRILVQEDTLEIPVPEMRKVGFNIQNLKTRSSIDVAAVAAEVSPEDALRTALRLGDSVIIVGEVRSHEAKVLYEAMRVGAVGNVVMGTIHGESAYSIWDRVVNDLGVPSTSFKATDMCVVAAPVRFGGSFKRHKRLLYITEVGKDWITDPQQENGLWDIMTFDGAKDNMDLNQEFWDNSVFLNKVAKLRGISQAEIWRQVLTRAESKQFLVDLKNKYNIPDLLESRNTVPAHNKLLVTQEAHLTNYGAINHPELLEDWKKWVKEYIAKPVVEKQRRQASAAQKGTSG
ncbi:MAG: type II/IV secretion system ATPase subunit, partial [Candidatus Diapherotrites archaeon]|nr:type II/IV secretion system ATPase subunit [Candidatus Diapherotrites archaeon]